MILKVCDCCKKELKDDYVSIDIWTYGKAEVDSCQSSKHFCEKCMKKILKVMEGKIDV